MSQLSNQPDLVAEWWDGFGAPLVKALTSIRKWGLEGNPETPRTVGAHEFKARVEGWMTFDGNSYYVAEGWAEIIADQATGPKDGSGQQSGSTVAYDLACQIALQNKLVGADMPECLFQFRPDQAQRPERPSSVGEDGEKRVFRNILAWWGVQRGVDIGLKAENNRGDEIKYNRVDGLPSACELVTEAFHKAGWREITHNMIVTTWQPHRYGGEKDHRKLEKKSNTAAYFSIFRQLDQLIKDFSSNKD